MKFSKLIAIILVVVLIDGLFSMCSDDGHAPGYGKTSKCTICGKTATHKTSNYGFCDKHWKKATGY